MPVIIRRNGGTAERRNGGTAERRNGGTAERRNGGTALLVTLALAALAMLLAVQPAAAQTNDYDANDNRLIEIDNLAQLNALRYDLNGNGLQDSVAANLWANYTAAFPGAPTDMGCPAAGCQGYELTRSLDFDTNGDGVVDGDDPDSYPNWNPIGQNGAAFRWEGHFEGNGHTIANLTITSSSVWHRRPVRVCLYQQYPPGGYGGCKHQPQRRRSPGASADWSARPRQRRCAMSIPPAASPWPARRRTPSRQGGWRVLW